MQPVLAVGDAVCVASGGGGGWLFSRAHPIARLTVRWKQENSIAAYEEAAGHMPRPLDPHLTSIKMPTPLPLNPKPCRLSCLPLL